MLQCPECKKEFTNNSTFCEECGIKLVSGNSSIPTPSKHTIFDKIEMSVFFRFTRWYAWVILSLAILGFIAAIIYLVPGISPLIKTDINVSPDEIKSALLAKKEGKNPLEEGITNKKLDPELMARLDKEIYELILLLPKKSQDEEGVERLRGAIKGRIARYPSMKEKVKTLKELKIALPKFVETEKVEAFNIYFNLKTEKENAIALGRTEALIKIATAGTTCFAFIMTISVISLILVLLAIERNTRKQKQSC